MKVHLPSLASRITTLNSRALLSFLAFAGIVTAINVSIPLTADEVEQQWQPNIDRQLFSLKSTIDCQPRSEICLFGSSLIFTPILLCDAAYENLRFFGNHLDKACAYVRYRSCMHLQHILSAGGSDFSSVSNLCVAGNMMSDNLLVFKKLQMAGKLPTYAVLCLAPRDFLDSEAADEKHTPTAQLLSDFTPRAPLLFDLLQAVGVNRLLRAGEICADRLRNQLTYCRLSCQIIFGKRSNKKSLISPSMSSAQACRGDAYPDLRRYRQKYHPANLTILERQFQCLDEFLLQARRSGVSVIVVDMPLTEENLALLDKNIYSRYLANLASISRKHGAALISPAAEARYDRSDFMDSCHLKASGMHKCLQSIALAIRRDTRAAGKLHSVTR
ncbi:MAG TPA: hypothetical protein V6D17_07010 [Candidatus Obscuribacterales bacterium]